jgi:hypothetical protein
VEKVWGARYILGARYNSKNTVILIFLTYLKNKWDKIHNKFRSTLTAKYFLIPRGQKCDATFWNLDLFPSSGKTVGERCVIILHQPRDVEETTDLVSRHYQRVLTEWIMSHLELKHEQNRIRNVLLWRIKMI